MFRSNSASPLYLQFEGQIVCGETGVLQLQVHGHPRAKVAADVIDER